MSRRFNKPTEEVAARNDFFRGLASRNSRGVYIHTVMKLSDCRRLIVFGGTFDPPHVAHLVLPRLARLALEADAVAYIPAARSPHKLALEPTPAHHRLAMLRLTLADENRALILTDELDRATQGEAVSYTVDTLEALRKQLRPDATMRLLLGSDQMRVFDTWHKAARIVELAEPLVMLRPPLSAESLATPFNEKPWRDRLLPLPRLDISSTDLRQRLANGETGTGWLLPTVTDYIRRHGLYRSRANACGLARESSDEPRTK